MKDEVLISLKCPELILTNMRLRSELKEWGKIQIKSIMLEDLCHSKLEYASNPKLLILAFFILLISSAGGGLLAGLGLSKNDEEIGLAIGLIGGFTSFIMVLIYLFTRRHILCFPSSRENTSINITVQTKGLNHNDIKTIIDTVEEAKNERILSIR